MKNECLHSTSGKTPYELCHFARKHHKELEIDKFINKKIEYQIIICNLLII